MNCWGDSIMAKKAAKPVNQPADEPSRAFELALTDSERITYQKAAERCGLSLVEWIRDRLNRAAKREAKES